MTSNQAWVLGLASSASFMMALDSLVVFASVGGYASPEQFSAGFAAAMGTVAALAFIGMFVALGMPARRPIALFQKEMLT